MLAVSSIFGIHLEDIQYTTTVVTVEPSHIEFFVPECYEELYCFSYNPNSAKEERQQGWAFVDLKAEYSRMGLPNSLWKVTPVNCDYKVDRLEEMPLVFSINPVIG